MSDWNPLNEHLAEEGLDSNGLPGDDEIDEQEEDGPEKSYAADCEDFIPW